MNKDQAKRWAQRHLQNMIEVQWHSNNNPLCYDHVFGEDVEGRELSEDDRFKVLNAMKGLLNRVAAPDPDPDVQAWIHGEPPRPTGKPRKRWAGWNDWKKQSGQEG